jgi:hypothetical protein
MDKKTCFEPEGRNSFNRFRNSFLEELMFEG